MKCNLAGAVLVLVPLLTSFEEEDNCHQTSINVILTSHACISPSMCLMFVLCNE